MKKNKIKENTTEVLLFPGEPYEFNENLLHYDAFGYHNGNLISKRCGKLLMDSDSKKSKENEDDLYKSIGRYYSPRVDDFVIGIITQKSSEYYKLDIGTYTYATLNSFDFNGATRKSKPNLNVGDILYARVSKLNKFDSPIISCISDINTKDWASGESFFGELKGGIIYEFPKRNTWNIINGYAINRITDYVTLDICIGFNGKMWIKSDKSNEIYKILIDSVSKNKDEIEKYIHETFNKMIIS
jgi:exosome complex RNA-binding protein Rrp4